MLITCTTCQTKYNLPADKVQSGPRKLKCYKCGNVFTIALREAGVPQGYEEFGDASKKLVPTEFAFLRETKVAVAAPSLHASRYEHIQDEPPGSTVEKAEEKATEPLSPEFPLPAQEPGSDPVKEVLTRSGLEQGVPRSPVVQQVLSNYVPPQPKPDEPLPAEPPGESEPIPISVDPGSMLPADQQINRSVADRIPAPGPAASPPQPQPQPAPSAPQVAPARVYQSWELEAPVDLESFAVIERAKTARRVGQVITLIFIVFGLFGLYVAWRNDWNLSIESLPEDIAAAFTGGQGGLHADVVNKALLDRGKDGTFLLVEGVVTNDGGGGRKNLMLRLRIRDVRNTVVSEKTFPLSNQIEKSKVMSATAEKLRELSANLEPWDKIVEPGDRVPFLVIVYPAPPGFGVGDPVEIIPVRGETAP